MPLDEEPSHSESVEPHRILVVEDNAINQKVIVRILQKNGFNPVVAENGREAVERLTQERFDLVLMDLQMPVMDGLTATRTIRDPASTVLDHAVLIVAVTAHAMKGDREKCIEAGMDDYLSKPVKPELLISTVRRLLP